MFTPRIARLCCAVSLLILSSVFTLGQTETYYVGLVSGCVFDPSHAVIRGASVFLDSLQMQTDEKGCFTFRLVTGKHRLKILAEAFSPYEKEVEVVDNSVKLDEIILEIRP